MGNGEIPKGLGTRIRRLVLEESKRAGVGHVGSSLSIADILAALFGGALTVSSPADPERDRFILSKGHGALALYAALHATDRISREELRTYCEDGTLLGVHPDAALGAIDFGTGSLGHGLPIAAGAALAARWQGSPRRTAALLSDAECNEGSTWEAAMFAGHHGLGNLVAIVDLNGQQALGHTEDILDLRHMDQAWRAFGWRVHEVDGHDPAAIAAAIAGLDAGSPPSLVLARTTFGKGASFMEGSIEWHYWPLSGNDYERAMAELDAGAAA